MFTLCSVLLPCWEPFIDELNVVWYFGPHVRSYIFISNIAFTESPVDYIRLSLSWSCQIASFVIVVNANTIDCRACVCSDQSLPSCSFSRRLRNLKSSLRNVVLWQWQRLSKTITKHIHQSNRFKRVLMFLLCNFFSLVIEIWSDLFHGFVTCRKVKH